MTSTRKIMAVLVLVALSIGTINAQDYNWRNDDYKVVKLKTNGYEKTTLNSYENEDLDYMWELDYSSNELR